MTALDNARILHLFANYKWTGPADPAIRAAAHLRRLGLDVVFAQARYVHPANTHDMARQLWSWRMPVLAGLQLRKHFHIQSLLGDVRRLRQILRRERFDLVHCHLPGDHLLATLACRRLSRPPAVVRSLYDPTPPRRGLRERFALARTAGVVAPTEEVAESVAQRFRVARDQVLVQEPVTERPQLEGEDLRSRWGLGPEHRIVGITARIQPHRRFELLWDMAAELTRAVPNARVVLLGRGSDEEVRDLVTRPVEQRGLQDKVVLPGYLREPDYSAALRSFDVFVFLVPGSDGTCRAVREALAFGLPVVASPRGILPELLRPRRDGEEFGVVCDEVPAVMAEALRSLLEDDDLREQFGAAALRRARLDLDPEAAARSLAGFYARLLEERR
ncbi:MAG: glycosyltransferase family 4 protein [Planctomycetota bacterium]|nr:glycosyltransferase family 4 protein [Planctomycetota bacterium]